MRLLLLLQRLDVYKRQQIYSAHMVMPIKRDWNHSPNSGPRSISVSYTHLSILFFAITVHSFPQSLLPVHQAVALNTLIIQVITFDLAGIAGISLHSINTAAIRTDHDTHMVCCPIQIPIKENCNHRKEDDIDVPFERIRRITGYLVGTLDRFNNGKRAEESDRVKHSLNSEMESL